MGSDGPERLHVRCGCGARISAPASAVGRQTRCPKCRQPLMVRAPGVSNGAAAPSATSPQETATAAASGSTRVDCSCGARLAVTARHAGHRVKCPKCGRPIAVPDPTPAEPALGQAPEVGDLLEGLAGGQAVEMPRTAAEPKAENVGGDLELDFEPVKRKRVAAPVEEVPAGPPKTCPSCRKSLPGSSIICIECGINLKTGRPLLTKHEGDLDAVYARTEGIVRWLSWLVPVGVYPVASEAFGLRTPWAIRGIALLTVAVSAWFFAVEIYNPEPSVSAANLMLWSGTPSLDPGQLLSPRAWGPEALEQAAEIRALAEAGVGYHPYQLLTHALLHGGVLHLAGNLLFLLVLGTRVNALIGNILTAILYPLLAVVSGTAHLMAMTDAWPHPMIGASGAIMGLAGMYLVLFPVHQVHMAAWYRFGLIGMFHLHERMFTLRGFYVVLFYIAFDVLFVAMGWQDDTAHWAHLGGFLSGAAVALVLLFARLVNARGGDIISAILGKWAWGLIGRPNQRRLSLW